MGTLYIKDNSCYFCQKKLTHSIVSCPNNITLPCLECKSCKIYLFTEQYYNLLNKLAGNSNHRLNHDVYKYQRINNKHHDEIKTLKTKPQKIKANKQPKMKSTKSKSPFKKTGSITDIPSEKVHREFVNIDRNAIEKCSYYRNKFCVYMDDKCNPLSIKCPNKLIRVVPTSNPSNTDKLVDDQAGKIIFSQEEKYVEAIVLSNNRKCFSNAHNVTVIKALLRVGIGNQIVIKKIPAAYCSVCNQYIILKTDYKRIKDEGGFFLCQVEDHTIEYLAKHKSYIHDTESKIHALGYNVIKQYGYTFAQRKIILANIIENYHINQQEILSMIDRNIARKAGLLNYSEAISKWKQDREFVANYQTGDVPEVIVDKLIIGKR